MELRPEHKSYLLSRGYDDGLIAEDKLVSLPAGRYVYHTARFELSEPVIAAICRYATGTPTAVGVISADRKAYRKYPTEAGKYLPIFYSSCVDFTLLEQTKTVFLCEGYFDRVALKRCNVAGAVFATLGVTVSDTFIKFLRHFSSHVWLSLDMDKVGADVTESLAKKLQESGLWVGVLRCQYKDPAQWLQKAGVNRMRQSVIDQVTLKCW
jgi:5S rRNA maturation endonuclease (ribonuclease M5)